MRNLKFIAGLALGTTLGFGSASAADLAPVYTKAPAVVVSPVYDWTGFYVGGHVGGGWSSGWNSTYNPLPDPTTFGGAPGSFGMSGSSVLGGVQGGYNWQSRNWVFGVEGDATWTHINANASAQSLFFPSLLPIAGEFQTMSRTVNWLASARARVGYAWDRTLVYVTGGAAWGDVSYSANKNVGATFTFPASFDSTKSGWVVGGGLEYAIGSNWTIRGEYLYYDLGSSSVIAPEVPAAAFSRAYSWNDTKIQSARFGVNYKFGGPVVAKY